MAKVTHPRHGQVIEVSEEEAKELVNELGYGVYEEESHVASDPGESDEKPKGRFSRKSHEKE